MRYSIVKGSKEEVKEEALRFLTQDVKPGDSYETKERTLCTIQYEEDATLLDEATGKGAKEEELYTLMERTETGAKVLFLRNPLTEEEYYKMAFFAPGEWGRYTRPFKGVQEKELFALIMLNGCFVKPVKVLSPDEALTPDFANEVNAIFWAEEWTRTKQEYEAEGYTLGTAFRVIDEEVEANPQQWEEDYKENLSFVGACTPSILSELTGAKIKDAEGYVKAMAKYLKASSFDERQERTIKYSFNFDLRDLFLKWLIYEFLRTEDYSHLKECLTQYKKFLLPKDWAKGLCYLNVEPEEYVVSKYLSKDALNLIGKAELRDIAQFTGTPLSLILKASKRKIWDF